MGRKRFGPEKNKLESPYTELRKYSGTVALLFSICVLIVSHLFTYSVMTTSHCGPNNCVQTKLKTDVKTCQKCNETFLDLNILVLDPSKSSELI